MQTQNPHSLTSSNFTKIPKFFKTLKPNPPPKFNPINLDDLTIHTQKGIKMVGRLQFHQVSDVEILEVNDDDYAHLSKLRNSAKKHVKFESFDVGKKPICGKDDLVMLDGGFDDVKGKRKVGSEGNVVIDVKDDDFMDDDCVFVKKEMNLLPRGKNKKDPICVDGYVKEEKVPKSEKKGVSIGVEKKVHCVGDECDDDVRIVDVLPSFSNKKRKSKSKSDFVGISTKEVGESSTSRSRLSSRSKFDGVVVEIEDVPEEETVAMFMCEICADSKPKKESFSIKGCSHSYCSECMQNYVASKLQDGVTQINCPVPGCTGVLEPEYCREILPFDVFVRWGNLLCESVILASQKFYCPFKDCSALLIDDGGETVTQSECPSCFRMFCAQCQVAWHEGIPCAEYKILNKDEREKEGMMLRNLAKKQNWQRCPKCKFYVEKSEGCLYMKCRCGIAFCYRCGAINKDHKFHYCKKCGR